MIEWVDFPADLQSRASALEKWLEQCVVNQGYVPGNIAYRFVDDREMLRLNGEFLNHHYITDILTFDYTQDKTLSCDIVICPAEVRRIAHEYDQPYERELARVLVHGLLHCMGWNDGEEKEKQKMRAAEDEALTLLPL